MKKTRFHKKLIMLTAVVGIMLLVASCGRGYGRANYAYGHGYDYPRRPYRYAVPPPVVFIPRYCPPRRGYYGGNNGRGRGRGRW